MRIRIKIPIYIPNALDTKSRHFGMKSEIGGFY